MAVRGHSRTLAQASVISSDPLYAASPLVTAMTTSPFVRATTVGASRTLMRD